jgi:electron transfer flavoprotein alpha subunit
MNRVAIGTQTFTLDMGLQAENPPNPNKADGSDAAELVSGSARITMTRQKYLPAVIDPLALADAQTYLPFWAQWGNAAGALTQIVDREAPTSSVVDLTEADRIVSGGRSVQSKDGYDKLVRPLAAVIGATPGASRASASDTIRRAGRSLQFEYW